jgi:hypothetical protein
MMNYDKPFEENKVPFGSLEEEVADDIPVMLSEGEYVIPADVVRYWGIKHLEEMRMMAKCGLMSMQHDGRLHMVDEDGEPVETKEQDKPQLEIVEVDIQAMQDDMSDQEEDDKEDDMDEQMQLLEDNVIEVDFDGKDEEDILKLSNGGDVDDPMGGMGEPSGPSGGIGGPDSGSEDDETDIGRATMQELQEISEGPGVGMGVAGDDEDTGLGVATPEEMQELQEGLTEIQEKAEEGLSKGYIAAGKTYGVPNVDLQNLSVPEKQDLIDRTIDARHDHDPTNAQLDLNARTERGFQAENPGVVGFTNALAGILSGVSPAIAATLAVGNVINATQGKEGIGKSPFGFDISGAIGDQLSGIAQDIVDFSETVPGNIDDTVAAGVEAGEEVGSADEDSSKKQKTFPDLNDLVKQTMQIEGIDKEIPIKNSLMSPTSTT